MSSEFDKWEDCGDGGGDDDGDDDDGVIVVDVVIGFIAGDIEGVVDVRDIIDDADDDWAEGENFDDGGVSVKECGKWGDCNGGRVDDGVVVDVGAGGVDDDDDVVVVVVVVVFGVIVCEIADDDPVVVDIADIVEG